jgi:lipoate-protein ligase A
MTDLADREWRFIAEQRRSGPVQMALDEVAAETAAEGGPRTVRVYRWGPSTLSLGYNQDPESVDWTYCEREGVSVTRRQTGGGGIYHDVDGDISYSIVAPADELPGDLLECYDLLCTPILDAFERMGVDAAFAQGEQPAIHQPACYLRGIHPAHDILASGQKISGNAQYRRRDAVVQHGSLSYSLDPERHLGVFATEEVGEGRFRERVTSVREHAGIEREEAVATLESALQEWAQAPPGEWTDAERERAREIAEEKYESESWNRERTDPLSV